jgi:N-acetylglucosaminyl-diphospho-decaprenol L-rhamnosyltransferase
MTDVSAAVVSYNTRELTLRCLRATEAAATADTTLTLVDNGSSDGTAEAARAQCPRWRVMVLADNPGYGAALNRAFAATPAVFHLALNADVFLEPTALETLRDFLIRTPGSGLAGPGLVYPDGHPQPSAKRLPALGFAVAETLGVHALAPSSAAVRRFYYADRVFDRPTPVEAVSGAAMLIRGDAYRRIGGFDEGFRMYFEETDLCRRLHAAGFEVTLVPGARAVHWHGASSRQTTVRQVEYYVSYVRFVTAHRGRAAGRVLAGTVALSTVLRMFGLVVKYPPLGARRTVLTEKLSACGRLLAALARPAAARS